MRLTWIAVTAAAMLGEAVSGCTCTPRPKTTPASAARVSPKPPPIAENAAKTVTPLSHMDGGSGITLYVETDRQQVAAIDSTGKVLWHRNLVVEAKIAFGPLGRPDEKPSIFSLSEPSQKGVAYMKSLGKSGDYVGIDFNNKEWGLIDVRTGEYSSLGRD